MERGEGRGVKGGTGREGGEERKRVRKKENVVRERE